MGCCSSHNTCGCSTTPSSGKGCCASSAPRPALPEWFRQPVPEALSLDRVRGLIRKAGVATVCQSARCPNMGTCWSKGVATFMILGERCSRACRFCAIATGNMEEVFVEEPIMVAEAVRQLGLRYAVVTSVTRDDLPDQGAGQFIRTTGAIRSLHPACRVELLIPDFGGESDLITGVVLSGAEVVGHNIETVRRLSPLVRPQAAHDRSLEVLKAIRTLRADVYVKSGLMVGLGESDDEVLEALRELKAAGCDIVTIGQYLAPARTSRHVPAARFVTPGVFEMYRKEGEAMGIRCVRSGALVRSSYLAEEGFHACEEKAVGGGCS